MAQSWWLCIVHPTRAHSETEKYSRIAHNYGRSASSYVPPLPGRRSSGSSGVVIHPLHVLCRTTARLVYPVVLFWGRRSRELPRHQQPSSEFLLRRELS